MSKLSQLPLVSVLVHFDRISFCYERQKADHQHQYGITLDDLEIMEGTCFRYKNA
jgi:hypothetical protein